MKNYWLEKKKDEQIVHMRIGDDRKMYIFHKEIIEWLIEQLELKMKKMVSRTIWDD